MKLVIGFGNPGREFLWTRHNFGHLALDFYAKVYDLTWKSDRKLGADITRHGDTILAKSHTYYNEVGLTVRKILDFYKLDPATDLLIVCDDINLDFGTIRYRERGSDGGNNGLKSTTLHLGSDDYRRLRIGANSPLRAQIGDTDFVLGKFTDAERAELPTILREITPKLTDFAN
jgi:PTH1 family peptidyl-tRNA hydrolase